MFHQLKELGSLTLESRNKDEKIKSLQGHLEIISNELNTKKEELKTLEEKCSDLSSQLETASREKENQQLNIDNLENKTKELNTKLVYSENVISELKLKVEALESDCSGLKNEHAAYGTLKENFVSLKEKLGDDEAELKCSKLSKQLEDVHKVVQDLETKINQLEEGYAGLKSINSELSSNLDIVKEKYSVLSTEHGSLGVDYEHLKQEKLAEADAHAKYVQELQNTNESYGKEVEDLSKQVVEAQNKKTMYENKIEQLDLDCALHKEKYTEMQAEISMLKAQLGETSKNKEIMKETVEKIAESEKSLGNSQKQVKDMDAQIQKKLLKREEEEDAVTRDDPEEYIVEKILDRRIYDGKTQYFLKWANYPKSQNSWEDERNLKCAQLIEEYEKGEKKGEKKKKRRAEPVKIMAPPPKKITKLNLDKVESGTPIQKAMQFVGSKIRCVAEAIISSPRVTRGRRKLFNVDAEPSMAEPKWIKTEEHAEVDAAAVRHYPAPEKAHAHQPIQGRREVRGSAGRQRGRQKGRRRPVFQGGQGVHYGVSLHQEDEGGSEGAALQPAGEFPSGQQQEGGELRKGTGRVPTSHQPSELENSP